jgi:hypothetical protein
LKEMEIVRVIVEFLVQVIIATATLWLAMRMTKEEGSVLCLFAAAFITELVQLIPIPFAGGILPFIVLLVLISRWTTAEIWPDAVLMAVVAQGLAMIARFALNMMLVQ